MELFTKINTFCCSNTSEIFNFRNDLSDGRSATDRSFESDRRSTTSFEGSSISDDNTRNKRRLMNDAGNDVSKKAVERSSLFLGEFGKISFASGEHGRLASETSSLLIVELEGRFKSHCGNNARHRLVLGRFGENETHFEEWKTVVRSKPFFVHLIAEKFERTANRRSEGFLDFSRDVFEISGPLNGVGRDEFVSTAALGTVDCVKSFSDESTNKFVGSLELGFTLSGVFGEPLATEVVFRENLDISLGGLKRKEIVSGEDVRKGVTHAFDVGVHCFDSAFQSRHISDNISEILLD